MSHRVKGASARSILREKKADTDMGDIATVYSRTPGSLHKPPHEIGKSGNRW